MDGKMELEQETMPKAKSKKGLFLIVGVVLVALAGAATVFFFLLNGGESSAYFYIQEGTLYYSPDSGKPQALSQVNAWDMSQIQKLTMVYGQQLVYPSLGVNGRYDLGRYDLYSRDIADKEGRLLIQSIVRIEALSDERLVLEDAEHNLCLYSGGAVEILADKVTQWERYQSQNALYYVTDNALFLYDLDTFNVAKITDDLSDQAVKASKDGSAFRYYKSNGDLCVYTNGAETTMPYHSEFLCEEAVDRFYVCVEQSSTAKVGDFLIDDMKSQDSAAKEPKRSDYEYDAWEISFFVEAFNGALTVYWVEPGQNNSNAEAFHKGEQSNAEFLKNVGERQVGQATTTTYFMFSKSDVLRLARSFDTLHSTGPLTNRGERYEGGGYSRTIGDTSYTISFIAEPSGDTAVETYRWEEAQNAYQMAAARNEFRPVLNDSIGKTYALYSFTPEEGLIQVADQLYSCKVLNGNIVATASIMPQETTNLCLLCKTFSHEQDVV